MPTPPTGTVTFLFTDIEGSTTRWEHHRAAMAPALDRHNALLAAAVDAHGGFVFKTVGDAFCAAFASPTDAVALARSRLTRTLTPAECRQYLHVDACPADMWRPAPTAPVPPGTATR
jgi:class 3 adenylate cyclase